MPLRLLPLLPLVLGFHLLLIKVEIPSIVAALGMTAGYCGTLLTTPMAANFNIVPCAVLETKDQKWAVIKAQASNGFDHDCDSYCFNACLSILGGCKR